MTRRLFLALVASAVILACDKNTPPPPSPGPQPADEPITGRERVGWDQQAGHAVDLSSFRYAIYVDATRSELTDASCASTPGPAGFACTAGLPAMSPGTHTLELAAFVIDGTVLESPRSAPLRVVVAGATAGGAASEWQSGAVITTADHVRLRLDLLADGLDAPTDMVFAPDGRLFLAERAGRVRVVLDGRLLREPALTLADVASSGGGGLLALALGPDFERTHFVYTLYTAPSRSGAAAFRLARFREVNDTLAERAILLDEIEASISHASASLRFGPDGKLYAAFDDGGDPRLAGDLSSFNGKVLRMNADGSTPLDQAAATPVYSYGYRGPRGLDWHPAEGTLWVADGGPQGGEQLRAVVSAGDRSGRGTVRAAYALPRATGASTLTFYRGRLIPAFRHDLFIAADDGRHILRVHFDAQDPTRIVATERLLQDRVGGVRVVASGPDGAIYFCTAHAVARLVPAPGS